MPHKMIATVECVLMRCALLRMFETMEGELLLLEVLVGVPPCASSYAGGARGIGVDTLCARGW